MKILLSAIACHPEHGSEAKVGWDAACAIASMPSVSECHVMTHVGARDAILRRQEATETPRMQFHFYGNTFRYHPNRLLARFQSWLLYRDWQLKSLQRAATLHQQYEFSLTHHVTYASWRMPPVLWRLPPPFVFGPVGGGSSTPHRFKSALGFSTRVFEAVRDTTTEWASRSKAFKLCCSRSSAILAADEATVRFFEDHGAKNVRQLCQVFFSAGQILRFQGIQKTAVSKNQKLHIFAGGNLEGRKGTLLTLHALSRLKTTGIPFCYTYGGGGPELESMRKLASQLGIAGDVCFHEGYTGEMYLQQLAKSDVYLLPSVRETAGITMMEAMMAGCYPIVLGQTGAGDIVERVGVQSVRTNSPQEAILQIAERLEWCHRHRSEMKSQAEAAGKEVSRLYSEGSYQKTISDAYADAVGRQTVDIS